MLFLLLRIALPNHFCQCIDKLSLMVNGESREWTSEGPIKWSTVTNWYFFCPLFLNGSSTFFFFFFFLSRITICTTTLNLNFRITLSQLPKLCNSEGWDVSLFLIPYPYHLLTENNVRLFGFWYVFSLNMYLKFWMVFSRFGSKVIKSLFLLSLDFLWIWSIV